MQGVGAILLTLAGWLFYCALHSYQPVNLAQAIITSPAEAKEILATASAAAKAEATDGAAAVGAAAAAGAAAAGAAAAGAASDSTAPSGANGLNAATTQITSELGYSIPEPTTENA